MKNLNSIDFKSINTIRTLSIDAIEKSNSGHPGLPMGAAPMAYVLWHKHLNINPKEPSWLNRDRFVLSAGHGSMLIYSLLHLSGYDLSLEDIKEFRQWGSKTPGHPEFGHTAGIETTTGPLGQGIGNAVGMAITERMLAARFNKPGFDLFDHHTYVLTGDGCLMEGISAEAASLAGHLKLGKLVMMYDSNDISLDGPTTLSFTEDVKKRFESYNWQVIVVADGDEDIDSIDKAIQAAKDETEKPSLIVVKTTIGYGSPNKGGTSGIHGSPLGAEETKLTKEAYGFDPEKKFFVGEDVRKNYAKIEEKGKKASYTWEKMMKEYSKQYPALAEAIYEAFELKLGEGWDELIPVYETGTKLASRQSSHEIMNAVAKKVEWLSGGDADLSCSTKTFLKDMGDFNGTTGEGRNIRFGVREHAMAAIANGMCNHGGVRPFTGTFFSFVDYMRPSVRLAALSKLPAVYIYTHDSVAVGEDGPTHQPVEQLMSIRSMPGLTVLRPGDANEVAESWKYIMQNTSEPITLVLSRQNQNTIDRKKYSGAEGVQKGAYVLADSDNPKVIIMATGSELNLALDSYKKLKEEGIEARVVSMPSWEVFEKQNAEYKESVLPRNIRKRVSIEAGVTFGWCRYTGDEGINIGIDTFGASAPGNLVLEKYGFSIDNVTTKIKEMLK